MDLGTGGGLPGIPLAILNPGIEVTMVDSIGKKIHAVGDILHHLSMQNAVTVCGRAEDLARREGFRSSFDYVISRAIGSVAEIIKWSKPFLKQSSSENLADFQVGRKTKIGPGSILMLKGGNIENEISEARVKLPTVKVFSYPIVVDGIDSEVLWEKKILITHP